MKGRGTVLCILVWILNVDFLYSELNLSTQSGGKWASEIGMKLKDISKRATGYDALIQAYRDENVKVRDVDGAGIVKKMGEDIVNMLSKKVKAVEKLAKVAEEAAKTSVYDPNINSSQTVYYNAKRLNQYKKSGVLVDGSQVMDFRESTHFNNMPVNLSLSTVHVPTNVYDMSPNILYGVNWTLALEDVFRSNYEEDPTLTWQYFGSSTGFLRVYPGLSWRFNDVDLYDCRSEGWYIQAATSPKDVVILVDASGSMLGQNLEIARSTVDKILETLSDNDFFNIMTFQGDPEYVDPCFNATLVQATEKNKLRLHNKLKEKTDDVANIAKIDEALKAAFELLKKANESGEGAQCNKAIMLITDGSPEMYTEVFREYNWPDKEIRVFSFLIGREVRETRQVEWMACSNKGYYTHISTLADVQENVQKYVNVTSRPLVISRAKHVIWTSVYLDTAGLKLMTSVAKPVYDIRPETFNEGNLLGVVGTDVPLEEIYKLTPHYKLGANGYAFAITNNGYVLFHPQFRPMRPDHKTKPHYNNVDLTEVEFSDNADYVNKLRQAMVDGGSGNMTMKTVVAYDDRKPGELGFDFYRRVLIRTNNYHWTQLKETPFTLGIALPEKYGKYRLEGNYNLKDYDESLFDDTRSTVKLSNWNYCQFTDDESDEDPVTRLKRYLQSIKDGNDSVLQTCRQDLLQDLLFDAKVSEVLETEWENITGVEQVWYGMRSGITRGRANIEDTTESLFINKYTGTIDDSYYKRAADTNKDTFIYTVPLNISDESDENNTVITAFSALSVKGQIRKVALAGVVGLQLKYTAVKEMMMAESRKCPSEAGQKCSFTCDSEDINCYLLDDNGYVVVSEIFSEVGKFFGDVEGNVMDEFINKNIFKRETVYDYQAVCLYDSNAGNAASYIINPFTTLIKSVFWAVQELSIFLVQFSIYNLLSPSHHVEARPRWTYDKCTNTSNLYVVDPAYLNPDKSVSDIMLHCTRCQNDKNCDGTGDCTVTCKQVEADCKRSYTIHSVPHTNLLLLQLDNVCTMGCNQMTVDNAPRELKIKTGEAAGEEECLPYKASVYRRRPSNTCYSQDSRESNDTATMCGGSYASQTSPLPSVIAVAVALAAFFARH